MYTRRCVHSFLSYLRLESRICIIRMLEAYFDPVPSSVGEEIKHPSQAFGGNIQVYSKLFPKLSTAKIAIVGIGEQSHLIRKSLYALTWRFGKTPIVDLGNFKTPSDQKQRDFAMSEALGELFALNLIVIVLSDDKSHLIPQHRAQRDSKTPLELACISPSLDFEAGSDYYEILSSPDYRKQLSNIDFIATQAYYISDETANQLDNLNFENYRLGNIRNTLEETEPILRSAHSMYFDLNAVRNADIDGLTQPSPNGLYAEEAVKIARYAGLSNMLNSATFYGLSNDRSQGLGDELVAQMVWYFVEGYTSRFNDHPVKNDENYLIYRNRIESTGHEITFYKSRKSDRWWMEVPHPYEEETFFIGCSYQDYQNVCDGDMPDRWWRAYQRHLG